MVNIFKKKNNNRFVPYTREAIEEERAAQEKEREEIKEREEREEREERKKASAVFSDPKRSQPTTTHGINPGTNQEQDAPAPEGSMLSTSRTFPDRKKVGPGRNPVIGMSSLKQKVDRSQPQRLSLDTEEASSETKNYEQDIKGPRSVSLNPKKFGKRKTIGHLHLTDPDLNEENLNKEQEPGKELGHVVLDFNELDESTESKRKTSTDERSSSFKKTKVARIIFDDENHPTLSKGELLYEINKLIYEDKIIEKIPEHAKAIWKGSGIDHNYLHTKADSVVRQVESLQKKFIEEIMDENKKIQNVNYIDKENEIITLQTDTVSLLMGNLTVYAKGIIKDKEVIYELCRHAAKICVRPYDFLLSLKTQIFFKSEELATKGCFIERVPKSEILENKHHFEERMIINPNDIEESRSHYLSHINRCIKSMIDKVDEMDIQSSFVFKLILLVRGVVRRLDQKKDSRILGGLTKKPIYTHRPIKAGDNNSNDDGIRSVDISDSLNLNNTNNHDIGGDTKGGNIGRKTEKNENEDGNGKKWKLFYIVVFTLLLAVFIAIAVAIAI